jgi:hypothetical protein
MSGRCTNVIPTSHRKGHNERENKMTTYSIRIMSNGTDFYFHTTSVAQLRELFASTYRTGTMGDFTIWADNEELSRSQKAVLAFGQLAYTN